MKGWKKTAIAAVVLILAVLAGIEVRMESRFRYWKDEIVSEDTEAILRKVPEACITEKDHEFLEEALQYPAVQEWARNGENNHLYARDCPDITEALQNYLPSDCADSLCVSLICYENGYHLVLDWENGKSRTLLEKNHNTEKEWYRKIFMPEETVYYQNDDNQQAKKAVSKRQWFAWLRHESEESGKNGE